MTARPRCERCRRPQSHCLCACISPIKNLWPVHILQHPQETLHSLGTARIADLGLVNCTLTVVGSTELSAPENTVLIYPGESSQPLSTLPDIPSSTLLFIDATWRKSRRMLFEFPALAALPRYCLASPPPSRYRIRKEPTAQALSTLEAIVYTLAEIEGNEQKYQPLLRIMDQLIEEQIGRMGSEIFANNYRP